MARPKKEDEKPEVTEKIPEEVKKSDGEPKSFLSGRDILTQEFSKPKFIDIKFQDGKKEHVGTNGCELVDAVEFVATRLKSEMQGKYATDEKVIAYQKMQEALFWLRSEK